MPISYNRLGRRLFYLVGVAFPGLPALALAAPLEEVFVSAQRQKQNLQQVPLAVSAISGAQLQRAGVHDLNQLQALAPALTLVQGSSADSVAFGIRGVANSQDNSGLESSVGLYVDGVYRAYQGAMTNNLLDVQRIEVLRGPQGTLSGRNTVAGAVSISTVRPDHAGSGYLEATSGSDHLKSVNGAVSVSLLDQVLAVRLSGLGMRRDGTVDDLVLGDNALNDRDRWAGRLQALYTPSDKLGVRVIADASALDENCCAIGSWKNNLVAGDLPPGSPPRQGTDATVLALGGTVIPAGDFYDYRTALDVMSVSDNEDRGLSVQVEWQLGEDLLTSISTYRSYQFNDGGDGDFTDIDAFSASYALDQHQYSQELRLSGEREGFTYVTGLYWFDNALDTRATILVGDDLSPLLGVPGSAFPGGSRAVNDAAQDNNSYALFGQVEFRLVDSLLLTTGLRWTREDKKLRNAFSQDASEQPDYISPGWGFWLLPSLAPRPDVREALDDDRWTGSVKLSWFATDNAFAYLSYATGYKAGGINTSRVPAELDLVFGAETAESWEIGLKTEFPQLGLRANIALFTTTTDDLQVSSFQGTGFALQNAGSAETYGGEMDLQWHPLQSLQLALSYAYNHGRLKDFGNGPCWIGTPWQTGRPDPGDNGDGSCDRSGGLLPGNPEHRGVLSGTWLFNLGENIAASLYGEYAYTGARMTELANDPEMRDGAYALISLRAGLSYLPWQASVTAWGRNITDAHYTQRISDAAAQPGRFIAAYTQPRSWGLTLRKEF